MVKHTMTREFRLVRAGKCPTSSMGGGSLALLLEPRCSKFRGEFTSFQAICSLELESLGVKPSPTWEALPFILQGGPPYLHISIVVSWSAQGSFVFVSRRARPGWSGVERLVSGRFSWVTGCQAVVPSLVNRSGFATRSGFRRSSPLLSVRTGASVRIAAARPTLGGF